MTYTIIDRRASALGGQRKDRSLASITTIGWHYTAVLRKNRAFITNHEAYWRDTLGWDRGGYHFYIDADGQIWQNYDYERITWGVKDNNGYVVHISVEAGNGGDYSQAQIDARDWLTRKIMGDLNIPASKVKGHWEIYNNSSCPGYTKAQMDAFRAKLAKPADATTPVVSTTEKLVYVDYNATIIHGGYSVDSKPWGETGFETWSHSDDWLFKTIHFREETADGAYANGDYFGWVDKKALGPERKSVNYKATVIADWYSVDSLPWGEAGYQQLGTTANHINSVVTVRLESLNSEYAYILNDEKEIGWVDKRALVEGILTPPETEKEPTVIKSVLYLPNGHEWVIYPENGPYEVGDVVSITGVEGSWYTVLGDREGGKVVIDLQTYGRKAIFVDPDKGAVITKTYA